MATAPQRDYDMTVYPIQVAVRSASDPTRVHMVTIAHCDCADFTNRRGMLIPVDEHTVGVTVCKHIVEAMARIGGWHRPEPEVFPNLRRVDAIRVLDDKAGLQGRAVTAALHGAHPGAPQFLPRPGKAAVTVEVTLTSDLHNQRRYTVTIPA